MLKLVLILLLLPVVLSAQSKKYQYAKGIPTKNGIRHYVSTNKDKICREVQEFLRDTIYSYSISTDDLSNYQDYDTLEAGRFYVDDEILITDELKFMDYELKFIPKWKQREYSSNNKFVKAVIIHELVHLYIYQLILDLSAEGVQIHPEYHNFTTIRTSAFGSTFIEEGICEYVVNAMKESINTDVYKPKTIDEIHSGNQYMVKYVYGKTYVQNYFNNKEFKTALILILINKPPSYEEILKPLLYYNRIAN